MRLLQMQSRCVRLVRVCVCVGGGVTPPTSLPATGCITTSPHNQAACQPQSPVHTYAITRHRAWGSQQLACAAGQPTNCFTLKQPQVALLLLAEDPALDLHAADFAGHTVLHHAARGGGVRVMEALARVKAGPDPGDVGEGRKLLALAAEVRACVWLCVCARACACARPYSYMFMVKHVAEGQGLLELAAEVRQQICTQHA